VLRNIFFIRDIGPTEWSEVDKVLVLAPNCLSVTTILHQRSVDSIQPYSRGVKRTWSSQSVSGSAVRVAASALVSERTRESSSGSVCPYDSRFFFV
jgi:hypothetical protein